MMIILFMNRKIKILLVIICSFSSFNKLFSQESVGTLIDKVVARVDDYPILKSEVEIEYEQYRQQLGPEEAPTKCQILENMIINKVILANAAKRGVFIKKVEIDRYFSYHMKDIINKLGSEARLEQYVTQQLGKSLKEFKEEIRKNIKNQLTVERVRSTIIDDITISPIEVKNFFEQLSPEEIPFYPAAVEAYHLVIHPPVKQQERQAALAKLESIKAQIQAGEDFGVLAKQYSDDIETAINGGEVGFWRIGELDPIYEKAVLALQPGEIAGPIETKYGFHIIQLIERQKTQYNTRHILLKPVSSEPNFPEAIKKLDDIRSMILNKQISFEQAIKTYSEDSATVQKGGLLTGGNEGNKMLVNDHNLPPDLFFILDKMVPGSISEPMIFNISPDKQAVRIIYLKEMIPSHQASLDQDYERIYNMALNAKKQKALYEWILKAKAKAVIEVDAEFEKCK